MLGVIIGFFPIALLIAAMVVDRHHQQMQAETEYEKNKQIPPASHPKRW
ncbi:MAG: hypothetical protein R6V60_16175 [Desulfobacterales bacterium]|jgi:hypothetical protein